MDGVVDHLIAQLNLLAHPEGGYFRQTYRSTAEIPGYALPECYQGNRAISTAIYYLLAGDAFSAFHRICSDEIWHFYLGSRVEIHLIDRDGEYSCIYLGSDLPSGEVFQAVVPGGSWFGARLTKDAAYCLVGCTVAPGFEFADFELADRDALIAEYPQHAKIIHQLTRK
jgi:uncharacterized protein